MCDLAKGVGGLAPISGAAFQEPTLKKIYSMSFRCAPAFRQARIDVKNPDIMQFLNFHSMVFDSV
jgi:hypothetical protein